jgi:hypothetical protein
MVQVERVSSPFCDDSVDCLERRIKCGGTEHPRIGRVQVQTGNSSWREWATRDSSHSVDASIRRKRGTNLVLSTLFSDPETYGIPGTCRSWQTTSNGHAKGKKTLLSNHRGQPPQPVGCQVAICATVSCRGEGQGIMALVANPQHIALCTRIHAVVLVYEVVLSIFMGACLVCWWWTLTLAGIPWPAGSGISLEPLHRSSVPAAAIPSRPHGRFKDTGRPVSTAEPFHAQGHVVVLQLALGMRMPRSKS